MPLFIVAGIAIVALGFVVLIQKWIAASGGGTSGEPEIKGGKTLVVLVHGTRNTAIFLKCMREILAGVRPDADLLALNYGSNVLSNADPFLISEQINRKIHEAYQQAQYESIILVGYSKGALLVRKALIYGYGHIEDLDTVSGATRPRLAWVGAVARLVLLAGMNRGWTLRQRPKQMALYRYWLLRSARWYSRRIGVAGLINRCESGEPFVANLRLQWLEVMRSLPANDRPVVVQLLGDRDDLVSSEDQRDVTVARDFIWVNVSNTGHPDIVEFDDPGSGPERRRNIEMALGKDDDIEKLRQLSSTLPDNQEPQVTELVVVLHGIRDTATWAPQFRAPLQAAYRAKHPNGNSNIEVVWPSYGYFPMGSFLLWADRQKNVRWFMDEFTEWKAKYPNLGKVHFIGHSNGTYVLGSALHRYKTLKVANVAFGGCVLRRNFDWAGVRTQFDQVRNYVASADWVVGLLPALFETAPWKFANNDLGKAGFEGFTTTEGNGLETRYLDGTHGIALDTRNVDSIVDFIINGTKVDNAALLTGEHPWKLSLSSRYCWVLWTVAGAILLVGLYYWITLFHELSGITHPYDIALAIFAFAVIFVLIINSY